MTIGQGYISIRTDPWNEPKSLRLIPSVSSKKAAKRGAIKRWSRKSRANLVKKMGCLDLEPMFDQGRVGLLTLTLPNDWVRVAPDGVAFNHKVGQLKDQYAKAWGAPLRGIWKREFGKQVTRRAPHTHIVLGVPPGRATLTLNKDGTPRKNQAVGAGESFNKWTALNWSHLCSESGVLDSDHLAHGTKITYAKGSRRQVDTSLRKYLAKWGQQTPPEEWNGKQTGRYWGVWGLSENVSDVELSAKDGAQIMRTLRRWTESRGLVHPRTGRSWIGSHGGFVLTDNGPRLASEIFRACGVDLDSDSPTSPITPSTAGTPINSVPDAFSTLARTDLSDEGPNQTLIRKMLRLASGIRRLASRFVAHRAR